MQRDKKIHLPVCFSKQNLQRPPSSAQQHFQFVKEVFQFLYLFFVVFIPDRMVSYYLADGTKGSPFLVAGAQTTKFIPFVTTCNA